MKKSPGFGPRLGAQGLGVRAWALGRWAWAFGAHLGKFPGRGLGRWKNFDYMQSTPIGIFLEFFFEPPWERNTLGVFPKKMIVCNQVFSGFSALRRLAQLGIFPRRERSGAQLGRAARSQLGEVPGLGAQVRRPIGRLGCLSAVFPGFPGNLEKGG